MFYKRRTHIKAGPTGWGVVVYVERAERRPGSFGHALTGRKGDFVKFLQRFDKCIYIFIHFYIGSKD